MGSTTNDLLLIQGLVLTLWHALMGKAYEEEGYGSWMDICRSILDEIRCLPLRLHYDDVKVLSREGSLLEVAIVNPSWRNELIAENRLTIRRGKIEAVRNGKNLLALPVWKQASAYQREILGAYGKEVKNILFHVNKRLT